VLRSNGFWSFSDGVRKRGQKLWEIVRKGGSEKGVLQTIGRQDSHILAVALDGTDFFRVKKALGICGDLIAL
jgi:hypothetical protein